MTVVVPEPVPLELPPGDPDAVEQLARDVTAAGFWLSVVADQLSGPAAAAPGWLGADAVAAEAQVVRVAGLTRDAATAVRGAGTRLAGHGELVRETHEAVRALRTEQSEDHRVAWSRLHELGDLLLAMRSGAPEAVAVVEDLTAGEAARRRRHALLLELLADDAAATARVLTDAVRPLGGTGRPGDEGRVLARLTADLPGWGRPELTRRGLRLADDLVRSRLTPEERQALAAGAVALAGHADFAGALLRGLGDTAFGQLLQLLGQDPDGPRNPIAALLAAAVGVAVPGEGEHDGVRAVLDATYVDGDSGHGPADWAAAGMAAVLAAGLRLPGGGPPAATVGSWARQLLLREHARRRPVGLPPAGTPWPRQARDPVALAVGILADRGAPGDAAVLLGDGRVWVALLLRFWGDGGTDLAALLASVSRDSGPAGQRAVRLGLETVGAGLSEGDPTDWTVDRETVDALSPVLAEAAAAHVPVLTGALTAAARGGAGTGTGHLLTGLAYVTVDRRAAATLHAALMGWSSTQSLDLERGSVPSPLPAVAVPSAFVAVREHGQRLTHALDGHELRDEAENKRVLWSWTTGLALDLTSEFARTPVGVLATLVDGYGAMLLGADGTWEQGPDRGLRFDPADAAAAALAALPPEQAARVRALQAQAVASFRRTSATLGVPAAPVSPTADWTEPLVDAFTDGAGGMAEDSVRERAERAGVGRALPGGN